MDTFNTSIHSPAQSTWKRKPVAAQARAETIVLTLDRNGNPEMTDPRSRGGFYPYLQKGDVMFSSPKGMLIDVSA